LYRAGRVLNWMNELRHSEGNLFQNTKQYVGRV